MDLNQQNYVDDLQEHSSNSHPSSPCISNKDKASQLNPRVGHEYQVEVPSIITQSEQHQLLMSHAESEVGHDNTLSFAIGLPIPVTWILNKVENSGHEGEDGKKLKPISFQSMMTEDSNSGQLDKSKKYALVPGSSSKSWSDSDGKTFLLGLYIFGKNFNQIKRFLENKEMGEMLAFYHGKFYKSDEYCRWSNCRKIKGRKSVIGEKLFTGRRLHKLLSRLILHVSEESKYTLLQVSKSYSEGRTSLEEYVSFLKSSVGLGVLVEAVGIESRLSKTTSNDLFWEAVWPRLLTRGWHSEQPKNQGYISSKDYMVFLIPGVKKYSRGKLVKGTGSEDDQSDYQNQCYLKPLASSYNTDRIQFMIIDTSLVHGGSSSELRELKPLPVNSVGKVEVNVAGITEDMRKVNPKKEMPKDLDQKLTDTSMPRERKFVRVRIEMKDTPEMIGLFGEINDNSYDYSASVVATDKLISSSAESIVEENRGKSNLNEIYQCRSVSRDKVEKCRSPVTFNTPQVPSKPENGEITEMMTMMEEDGQCLKVKDPCLSSDPQLVVEEPLKTSCEVGSKEQQPNVNSRRQSTRNRWMTVKAMEYMTNDFLNGPRRQKRKHIQTHKDTFSDCRRSRTSDEMMLDCHSSDRGPQFW
ncbi:hypothetical protein Fmac_006967 [Flemingia macrophylla]|uniref:SANT domain-containing protein n=1 Tax=Flemingia macrophylla TaxID=520843 RepID=A0ABD1NC39_9FABA